MNITSTKIIIPFVLLIIIGTIIVVNVSIFNQNDFEIIENNKESTENKVIRIGTVGDDAAKLTKRFFPTAEYLAEKLSNENTRFEGQVSIVQETTDMEKLLLNQEIDLYFESPLTAYLTSKISDSEIFLLRWKEGISSYNSVFYVEKNSNISSLDDLIGKTIAFQSPESTSGYLLPLYHLVSNGFSVDETNSKNINYVFSGDDENSIIWVIENRVDAGVSSNQDIDELPDDIKSQLKIIDNTIELPRQFVSHRGEMNPEMVENIKNILLNMHNEPEGKKILEKFKDTSQYSEIENKQELFDTFENILEKLEMK